MSHLEIDFDCDFDAVFYGDAAVFLVIVDGSVRPTANRFLLQSRRHHSGVVVYNSLTSPRKLASVVLSIVYVR